VIANNDFYRMRGNATIAEGNADMIAFGKPFISTRTSLSVSPFAHVSLWRIARRFVVVY
jgi:hypothetical protein